MKKIYSYDPHCGHHYRQHLLQAGEGSYHLEFLPLGKRPHDGTFYFLMDHFAVTKLPYFFPRSRRVAVLKENPTHTHSFDTQLLKINFDLVLTHRADLIEAGPPFCRVDFGTSGVLKESMPLPPDKKHIVSFVGSIDNPPGARGHDLRKQVAHKLAGRNDLHWFGRGIRPVEQKSEGLSPYCFSVAIENSRENYYYTEKLIDCFFCETVPIYWGCPELDGIFDPRGVISFETLDELIVILNDLSFEKYRDMLPFVRENRERCLRQKLDTYENYLTRCIEATERNLKGNEGPLSSWSGSRACAMLRLVTETILRRM